MAEPKRLAIDLTTTQQEILPDNPARRYAIFSNDSDTVCYISLGTQAVANEGIRLNASGGTYEIIKALNSFTGKIYAVSAGATKRLNILELS